jgi:hypothetical protein
MFTKKVNTFHYLPRKEVCVASELFQKRSLHLSSKKQVKNK